MKRTAVTSILVAVVLLAVAVTAEAQQPGKVPRLGYLSSSDPASDSPRFEAIRVALRNLGYIEGQNIASEYRYAEGKLDRLPDLATELVRLKVDIIVVGGDIPTRAAMKATKTIPIVIMGTGSDPVAAGLVESLARPGGNVTGITTLTRELGGKRLELLKEAVPKVARVTVLYDPTVPDSVLDVKEVLPVAARALKMTIQPWEVRGTDDFEKVFSAMAKQRPDGLYATAGPLNASQPKTDRGLCVKEPVTVDVHQHYICGCRRAHVLWGRPSGQLPASCRLRGQDTEGSQACRSTCRAADEV
jgi:putative ABC transport system substrate-binding protein